ncbi:MAG: hypothetical protein WCO84_08560, partial [bacterium]
MFDPRTLAIGVGCFVKGWAVLDFPGSTRANPSYQVYVQKSSSTPQTLPLGNGVFQFPLIVPWDIWQYIVVPIFAGGFTPPEDGSFLSLVNVLEA